MGRLLVHGKNARPFWRWILLLLPTLVNPAWVGRWDWEEYGQLFIFLITAGWPDCHRAGLFFFFSFFGDVLEELTATSFKLGMYAVGRCLCMYVGKIFIVIRTAFIPLRFVIMIRRRRVRGRTWEVTSLPCPILEFFLRLGSCVVIGKKKKNSSHLTDAVCSALRKIQPRRESQINHWCLLGFL